MAPLNKTSILRDRAGMLAASRHFFAERSIVEVDCPLLTAGASVDAHIDLIAAYNGSELRYMHSSPEYGMKRLLSEGMEDIYQLSHVFRGGEESPKHNPEFMMAEWYRLGCSFESMMLETCAYIRLFLGDLAVQTISYREVFKLYVNIDYVHASTTELLECLRSHGIAYYPGVAEEGKDAILNLILGTLIEPRLGEKGLLVLAYYPSTQAALAETQQRGDEAVAERFEVYYKGVELANGYHELADAEEQRHRLVEANAARVSLGKEALPVDEHFLAALAKKLPDCCGVAVGFDRLMMLRHRADHIKEIMPFHWPLA